MLGDDTFDLKAFVEEPVTCAQRSDTRHEIGSVLGVVSSTLEHDPVPLDYCSRRYRAVVKCMGRRTIYRYYRTNGYGYT